MDQIDQKVCIVSDLANNVTKMLSAQSFNSSPQKSQNMAKPQNVESSRVLQQTVQTFKTSSKQFKPAEAE
jgi:hypothetical protein